MVFILSEVDIFQMLQNDFGVLHRLDINKIWIGGIFRAGIARFYYIPNKKALSIAPYLKKCTAPLQKRCKCGILSKIREVSVQMERSS